MKELYVGFISFGFGILAHILYGVIEESRSKKRVKLAIFQEIQTNYFQVRDGHSHTMSKRNDLGDPEGNKVVVINDYRFRCTAYESNISDISLLDKDIAMKIHHFYSRLRALESVVQVGVKLLQESKEIEKRDGIPRTVKAIDGESLSACFHQAIDEYRAFEKQALDIGFDLVNEME